MVTPTGYHEKIIEIAQEIVDHGFGRMEIIVQSSTDEKVKVIINAGRSWVFFVHKEIPLKKLNVL
jgi:hypothetical protein